MSEIDTSPVPGHRALALHDVSLLIEATDPETIEQMVAGMDPVYAVMWLARAIDFAEGLNLFIKNLQGRVAMDPGVKAVVGSAWKDPGTGRAYEVRSSRRGGFNDVPGLYAEWVAAGGSPASFIGAINGLRVTDLKAAANAIPGEGATRLRAAIDEFRKLSASAPRLVRVGEDDE